MEYNDVVRDFAIRTRKNLEVIKQYQREHPGEAYETTQLINSLLGLLIFPKERYFARIPKTSIENLKKMGWPIPDPTQGLNQVEHLQQFLRYLRNAISHNNIKYLIDGTNQICGIKVWNCPNNSDEKNWEAKFSLADIEEITARFLDVVLPKNNNDK